MRSNATGFAYLKVRRWNQVPIRWKGPFPFPFPSPEYRSSATMGLWFVAGQNLKDFEKPAYLPALKGSSLRRV
jgi:hypothetical protein